EESQNGGSSKSEPASPLRQRRRTGSHTQRSCFSSRILSTHPFWEKVYDRSSVSSTVKRLEQQPVRCLSNNDSSFSFAPAVVFQSQGQGPCWRDVRENMEITLLT